MALIELRGGKKIGFAGRGTAVIGLAIVNDDIAEIVNRSNWCLSSSGYAVSRFGQSVQAMHHFVYKILYGFDVGDGFEIDHIDRNKLNNFDSNLRRVTSLGNKLNRSMNSSNTSGFVGVHFLKHRKIWQAAIWSNYKKIHLGSFSTKESAAVAVNDAYRAYYPYASIPNPQAGLSPISGGRIRRAKIYRKTLSQVDGNYSHQVDGQKKVEGDEAMRR